MSATAQRRMMALQWFDFLFVVFLFVVMFGIDLEYAYTRRWGCFGKTAMRLEFSDLM